MAIMLRRPNVEMTNRIPRRFTDMMDDFVNEALNLRKPELQTFVPTADIYEDDKYFYVNLYVPGLNKDDIHLSINDDTLTIYGERSWYHDDKEQNRYNVHLMEGNYGRFERTFTLPHGIDTDNIEARCENGILWVQILKSEERTGKKIDIK